MAKTKQKKNRKANPMWGGQFAHAPSEMLAKINASIGFDKQLYRQDIAGSIAHAEMLAQKRIISQNDCKAIVKGLQAIRDDIENGHFAFKDALEDIHMNIESALKGKVGAAAGRLHTARSRNDQVATDLRLYVRDAFDALEDGLRKLQQALIKRAEQHAETIMPGFTHLQVAQPVTLGHHLLAYVEMFGRDRERVRDARQRLNESPLGAAALAGTSFPIDRKATARALGFLRPMANSLDAVSDRDFALEFLSLAAIVMVHLSRLAEEFVLWSSTPFGFIEFSDAYATGSSIMPQKRNPDAAELVRGKSGRIFGNLMALLTVMKALPLAYNKDMQEDKEPVFDSERQLTLSLAAMRGMVMDFSVHKKALRRAAESAYADATDLADWLVRELGLPFREAHHITARLVARAAEKKCRLDALSVKEMQRIAPKIHKGVYTVLNVERSAASRTSYGGTAPANVRRAIAEATKRFVL